MTDNPDGPDEREVARLQAERDVLAQRVVKLEDRAGKRHRLRGALAAFLVVLLSITFTASTVAVWARRNFLNTTVFSERAAPLATEPAVKAALSRKIGDEVTKVIDAKRLLEEALPDRARVLAGPLSGAINGFIQREVTDFVGSEAFDRLWVAATRESHRAAVALLRGEKTELASTEGGEVTLNLVPIINEVLAIIGQQNPEIFGRTVNLPTITVHDAPDAAVQKLESALGVNLQDGYGEITVFDSDELSAAQDAIALFDKLTVLLIVLTVLLIPLTLWAAPVRRRTLLQLTVGVGLGMVLVRRFSYLLEGQLLDLVRIDENKPAVEEVLGVFVEPLRTACLWILAGLAAIAAVALVSGPYPWAERLRQGVVRGARGMADVAGRGVSHARDPRAAEWLLAHRDQIRIGEIVVAFLVLLFVELSWLTLLLLALVIGALELFFARSGPERPHQSGEPGPERPHQSGEPGPERPHQSGEPRGPRR